MADINLMNETLCSNSKDRAEIASFANREDAEKFSKEIKALGLTAYVCRDIAKEGGFRYKLFADESSGNSDSDKENEDILNIKKSLTQGKTEDAPISDAILGRKKRYLHPFISVTGLYTDNILNSNKSKKGDFISIISPGIWLSAPHSKNKPALMRTSSLMPGGFIVENLKTEFFRRYTGFLHYNADIQLFAKHPRENSIQHKAEGFFEFNMKNGFSLEVQDQYMIARDDRGTDYSGKLDSFKSNLFNIMATFYMSRKTTIKAGYARFDVDYEKSVNNFRDRTDNAVSGYILYKIRPRLDLLAEYRLLNIHYKSDKTFDSKEHHFLVGIKWDITSRTEGVIKAGYGVKDFNKFAHKSRGLILEADVNYILSKKSSLSFTVWRKTNESNLADKRYILSSAAKVGYALKLTGKLTGLASLSYMRDRYKGSVLLTANQKARADNYMMAGIGVQYKMKKWLTGEFGYIHSRRDSNLDEFDYSNNSVYLRLSGTM